MVWILEAFVRMFFWFFMLSMWIMFVVVTQGTKFLIAALARDKDVGPNAGRRSDP